MSERGGGGTPGNPPRIPGIPSNAHFHELAEWRTLDAQRPRPSIQDQEMAWCQNLMPIGAYYLRALPDHGTAIFGVPTPPFASYAVSFGLIPASFNEVAVDQITNGRIVVEKNPPIPPYGPPQIVSNSGTFGPLTTTFPNEVIVVLVSADIPASFGPSPIVTSISGAGLVFQRRFIFQSSFDSTWNGYGTPVSVDMEVWWAIAPMPLVAQTFTVTFADAVESAVFGAFGIANVDISDPWDATPVTSFNPHFYSAPAATIVETGPLNTSGSNDIAIAFFSYYANDVVFGYVYPGPWGNYLRVIPGDPNWENAGINVAGSNLLGDWNLIEGFYNIYTSPQTGLMPFALENTGPAATDWIAYGDALKGFPAVPYQPSKLVATGLGMPASATTFLFAGWIYIPAADDGDVFNLISDETANSGLQLSLSLGSGIWRIDVSTYDAGHNLHSTSIGALGVDFRAGWHSLAVELNTVAVEIYILVDQVYAASFSTIGQPIAMGATDAWEVGGNQQVAMNLGQMWFAVGQPFFDLSVLANQQALFGLTNCVTDWGVHGEAITGTEPQVFLFGPTGFFPDNLGTGGAFTLTGGATFVDAGSVPPLCP